MGYEQNCHAVLFVEAADDFYYLAPAAGVEHGGGFVEDENVGADCQHARDGYALFLPARKPCGRGVAELRHADGVERPLYAPAYLLALYAEVFRTEGNVVLYNRGDHLVVGILKDYARVAAGFKDIFAVGKVEPEDVDCALVGFEQSAGEAGERGLARAVVTDNRNEFTLFNRKSHPVDGGRLVVGIRIFYAVEGKRGKILLGRGIFRSLKLRHFIFLYI